MQAADGTVLITQNFPQYLIGVFTENRGSPADLTRGFRQLQRTAQEIDLSEGRVQCLGPHLPMDDLRIVEGFIDAVDASAGDTLRLQQIQPVARIFALQ